MSAVPGENAITVWSLLTGKPLFRIESPDAGHAGTKDSYEFEPKSFSGDGRYLLATVDHRRVKSTGDWVDNKIQLVLISIPEEKIVKTIYTLEGPCPQSYGIRMECSQIMSAYITADGRLVRAWTRRFLPEYLDGSKLVKWTDSFIALTLDGQKTMEESEVKAHTVPTMSSDGGIVTETPNANLGDGVFDRNGRKLVIRADKDTCALMDATNRKRLAFLDGCTEKDRPAISSDYDFACSGSENTPDFKIWGFDGALRARLPREALAGYKSSFRAYYDDRIVIEELEKDFDEPRLWNLWDTKTAKKVASGSGPLFSGLPTLAPDRRHIIFIKRDSVVYASFDAGVPLPPAARPVFTADIGDVIASAAPAPAPAPTPAAPARSYDAPPASTGKTDADAYAVIIGVEKYRAAGIPRVDYAARDAKTMYDYATGAMGFDAKNVVLLTDDQATKTDFEKTLGSWLKNRVGAKSRVFVYYAGHGSPNPATGEGYLMPYEADPNYLEDTAYPVAKLYAALAKLPTKDVTVVLDACFSGQGGRSLIAKGARPLVSVVAAKAASNTVVLAAAESSQISASNPERRHGLLTSYLLEALNGAADADGDGQIMSSEIYAFVRPAVERAARLQNLEQTPTMTPSPEALKANPGRPWIYLPVKK